MIECSRSPFFFIFFYLGVRLIPYLELHCFLYPLYADYTCIKEVGDYWNYQLLIHWQLVLSKCLDLCLPRNSNVRNMAHNQVFADILVGKRFVGKDHFCKYFNFERENFSWHFCKSDSFNDIDETELKFFQTFIHEFIVTWLGTYFFHNFGNHIYCSDFQIFDEKRYFEIIWQISHGFPKYQLNSVDTF